ncbi:MAG: hypothetical protein R3B46_13825 [Phycisphaerales bacterium]|nr:hypothetical protein [Phycisphaerales bacterium]
MNELTRSNQPGDASAPNRWEEFVAATKEVNDLIKQHEGDRDYLALGEPFDFSFVWDTRTTPAEQHDLLRQDAVICLQKLRDAGCFDRLASFIEPASVYYEYQSGPSMLFTMRPELNYANRAAMALNAEFVLSLEQGRVDDAVRAFDSALAVSRVSISEPMMLGQLLGMHRRFHLFARVHDAVARGLIGDEVARRLLSSINDSEDYIRPLNIEGERFAIMDIIQRTHSDDGHGDGMFLPAELAKFDVDGSGSKSPHPISNVAGVLFPSKKETTRKINEYFDRVTKRSLMDPVSRKSNTPSPDDWIETELNGTDVLLAILLPALDRACSIFDSDRAVTNLTRLLLALVIYHAEHGEYPDALDALTPGILNELPIDGFAPDGKYRYAKRTPTEEDPRAFILYSVGGDFTDDGGLFSDNRSALTQSESPMDFVVTPPIPTGDSEKDE